MHLCSLGNWTEEHLFYFNGKEAFKRNGIFCDAKGITCGGTAKLLKNLQVSDIIEAMADVVENIQTPNQTLSIQ